MNNREKLYYHCLLQGLTMALDSYNIEEKSLWEPWGATGQGVKSFGENLSPKNQKIATKAHLYADNSKEGEGEEMSSPFSLLQGHRKAASWIAPSILTLEKPILFPQTEKPDQGESWKLLQSFLQEWRLLSTSRSQNLGHLLLPLMEKHLSTFSSGSPGVSLYDHARVAAAIAVCFHDSKGEEKALLVKGDLSGIQDFIFKVKSKGASKALKARSAEVLLLSELIVERLKHKLELLPAQILYIGGGNFYFLSSAQKEDLLLEQYAEIKGDLLEHELQLFLGHTLLNSEDFREIGAAWTRVEKALQNSRQRPSDGIWFEQVFGQAVKPLPVDNREWQKKAAEYKNAAGFMSRRDNQGRTQLGNEYSIQLTQKPLSEATAYNQLDLLSGWGGFRFVANRLPLWEKEQLADYESWEQQNYPKEYKNRGTEDDAYKRQEGNIIDFQALAGFSARKGASRHLGILKLDVDNLGKLFREGFPPQYRSLSRTAAMSRSLKWFFAGYLDELTQQEPWQGLLYIIFSGGDDFFLAGPWHLVFEFAGTVRREFAKLVGDPSTISLSASLLLLRPGYPVNRFSDLSEHALDKAKSGQKDQVNLFGETLSWKDFHQAIEIKNTLIELIQDGKTSKAILNKLRRSATGFESLRREPGEVMLRFPKLWRLRYFLRDAALGKDDVKKANEKEIETRIIEPYEKLVSANFTEDNQRDNNPILFTVAARWAEFSIRNKK